MRIKNLYAETASIEQLAGFIESSSYALTASYALSSAGLVESATSASYALTASYAENVSVTDFSTGSYTGSFTGSIQGSASYSNTSSYAMIAQNLLGAIVSASYALTASYVMNGGGSSESASYAETSSYAVVAQTLLGSIESASYALTASYAENGGGAGYDIDDGPDLTFAYYSGSALSGSELLTVSSGTLTLNKQVKIGNLKYEFPTGSVLDSVLYMVSGSQTQLEETSSRTGWTNNSSTNGGSFANSIDGNSSTRWDTSAGQTPGQVYSVNFGAPILISKFIMDTTVSSGDYPATYSVSSSLDNVSWTSHGTQVGSTVNIYEFSGPTEAQYLRFEIVEARVGPYWSIHEFNTINAEIEALPVDLIWSKVVPTASLALSSSYALSASYVTNGGSSESASYAETSSYALTSAGTIENSTSASYALTASYALNGGSSAGSSYETTAFGRSLSYMDDFFTGSVTSSKWNFYGRDGTTATAIQNDGDLMLQLPPQGGGFKFQSIYQEIPNPSGSWTYSTCYTPLWTDSPSQFLSLGVRHELTSSSIHLGWGRRSADPVYMISAHYWSNDTTFGTFVVSQSQFVHGAINKPIYLELSKDDDTLYFRAGYTPDSVKLLITKSVSEFMPSGPPTQIFLGGNSNYGSGPYSASFAYFVSGSTPSFIKDETTYIIQNFTGSTGDTVQFYNFDAVPESYTPTSFSDEFTGSVLHPKWIQVGTSSFSSSITENGLEICSINAGNNFRGYVQELPDTDEWSVQGKFFIDPEQYPNDQSWFGLMVQSGSNGPNETFLIGRSFGSYTPQVTLFRFSNTSSYSSTATTLTLPSLEITDFIYCRINKFGSNIEFLLSATAKSWIMIYSQSVTSFTNTPDRVGPVLYQGSNNRYTTGSVQHIRHSNNHLEKMSGKYIELGAGGSSGGSTSVDSLLPPEVPTGSLLAWYKSDAGILQDDGNVYEWENQVGHAGSWPSLISSGTSRPTYESSSLLNGQPYLNCLSSSYQFMSASLGSSYTSRELLIWIVSSNSGSNQVNFQRSISAWRDGVFDYNDAGTFVWGTDNASDRGYLYSRGGNYDPAFAVNTGSSHLYEIILERKKARFYGNGERIGETSTGVSSYFNFNKIAVNNYGPNTSQAVAENTMGDQQFAELIFASGTISLEDRAKISTYLSRKYNLPAAMAY